MAWFKYKCLEHGEFKASLKKMEKTQNCPCCSKPCYVILSIGTSCVSEIIDNGWMSKVLERNVDMPDLMDERQELHERKHGDNKDNGDDN